MYHPLDDLSNLETYTPQKIMKMEDIPEPLLWRGQPQPKKRIVFWGVRGLLLAVAIFLITAYMKASISLVLFAIGILGAMFIGAISFVITIIGAIVTSIQKQTHYGISQTIVWVKPYNRAVQQYSIAELGKLRLSRQTISGVIVHKSTYKEWLVLEHVPDASTVYDLLLKLQQEQSS